MGDTTRHADGVGDPSHRVRECSLDFLEPEVRLLERECIGRHREPGDRRAQPVRQRGPIQRQAIETHLECDEIAARAKRTTNGIDLA